ncbi:MAG: AmmeMemoRadiSam system radical SAM enzyme, partial [Fidelibacterota bacterium]
KSEGINYAYLGNVPGHKYENTYCPTCGELLIKRYVFRVVDYRITPEKRCPKCDMGIPITGDRVKKI